MKRRCRPVAIPNSTVFTGPMEDKFVAVEELGFDKYEQNSSRYSVWEDERVAQMQPII